MKCHYTHDKEVGKVLIPGCMAVANSNDINDCCCVKTYDQFEKERYNQILKSKNDEIKELEDEIRRLKK